MKDVFPLFLYIFQMKLVGDNISEGDVILCNHPSCGGSHLPDLTVITPVRIKAYRVFYEQLKKRTDYGNLYIVSALEIDDL